MRRFFPLNSLLICSLFCGTVVAKPHEMRIPLHDGKMHLADLSKALCREIHVPGMKLGGEVDVRGLTGSLFVTAINASLEDGCQLTVQDDVLILHIDSEHLPKSIDQDRRAIRKFFAADFPEATARQARRYGLFLPPHLDPGRPLVVLLHGLDTGIGVLQPMGELLQHEEYQVGYFVYPADEAIEESSKLLAQHMNALHDAFPALTVNVIGHSMGGLVARDYVEGPHYAGAVDHLILVGTPNGGSKWASVAFIQKIQEHYQLWRYDQDWSFSWVATEGLGEAWGDLKPGSAFLRHLNSRPLRDGVRYTIIAGDQSPAARIGGNVIESVARGIPFKAAGVWGLRRQCRQGLRAHGRRTSSARGAQPRSGKAVRDRQAARASRISSWSMPTTAGSTCQLTVLPRRHGPPFGTDWRSEMTRWDCYIAVNRLAVSFRTG